VQQRVDGGDTSPEPAGSGLPSSTQLGFLQVALMKVLQTAKYPEREAWLEQFKAIATPADAELFMVEAKLQMRHDIDFKRPRRLAKRDRDAVKVGATRR
jgi:hypothetical protein